jgi:putative FmdB family regulatory protein
MPLYTYRCQRCDITLEQYRKIEDRLRDFRCPQCGKYVEFILDFSKRQGPSYPYVDEYMDHKPVTIESRSHRLRELKKRGLQETGVRPGMPGRWV